MECKQCNSKAIKNGHKSPNGKQVYRCTVCDHCFTGESKRRLTEEQKDALIARLFEGIDKKSVAEEFGISKRTVQRIIKARQQQE